MQPLRHLLLAGFLFFAQMVAGAHAVGHAADHEDGSLPHVCELCLVAHDLGTALPTLAVLPTAHVPEPIRAAGQVNERRYFPTPAAPQRGPPIS